MFFIEFYLNVFICLNDQDIFTYYLLFYNDLTILKACFVKSLCLIFIREF
jgi:hypothetical protein